MVTSIVLHFLVSHFFKSDDDKLQPVPHEQSLIAAASTRVERAVFKFGIGEPTAKVLLRFRPAWTLSLTTVVVLVVAAEVDAATVDTSVVVG